MTRRGSDYLRQAQQPSQDRGLVGASGDQHGFMVEATDTGKHERRGAVRWAGTNIVASKTCSALGYKNAAKVVPTEGPSGASASKQVPSP